MVNCSSPRAKISMLDRMGPGRERRGGINGGWRCRLPINSGSACGLARARHSAMLVAGECGKRRQPRCFSPDISRDARALGELTKGAGCRSSGTPEMAPFSVWRSKNGDDGPPPRPGCSASWSSRLHPLPVARAPASVPCLLAAGRSRGVAVSTLAGGRATTRTAHHRNDVAGLSPHP